MGGGDEKHICLSNLERFGDCIVKKIRVEPSRVFEGRELDLIFTL